MIQNLEFRPVRDDADILEIVRLQQEVWGFDDLQISPPDLLKVHKKLGGTVFGAFLPNGSALAFCYSFCGLYQGEPIHWSHMLGVSQEARGLGLGKRLKWMQREHMQRQNIRLCQWTWDPLEPLNSHMNIVTLGAVSNMYEVNVYGITSGPLHTGLPTDRFVANWWLDSERVNRAEQNDPVRVAASLDNIPVIFEPRKAQWDLEIPGDYSLETQDKLLAVPIRRNMMELKFDHPDAALRWREATREILVELFGRGYSLTDVKRDSRFGKNYMEYILEKGE